jgi:hypothetical protein
MGQTANVKLFSFLNRHPESEVSLEQQIRILSSCGINLKPGISPDSLLSSFSREAFQKDPYRLLLAVLGDESADGPYPSDNIWHFDTECIEGQGSYVRIAQRLAAMAQGDLPLKDVADHVDLESGTAWLSFTLDGHAHKLAAQVNDDWVDPKILSELARLLESRRTTRRFTYTDLKGQDCFLGCATVKQRDLLASRTGLKVEWLK